MRIVGLDIGASAVKLVEIDSAFGRFEIHDHREIAVFPGQEAAAVAGEALRSLPQPPNRLVVSLKSSKLTTRNLQLPTRDRKAIQSAIAFELEDELPFPIENCVIDSAILAQVGQQSQVHVATTLRKLFAPELARLQAAGVDPDVVTSDSWALRTLVNRVVPPTGQEKPLLLAQIGDQSTLFYIHWRGFPMLGREIAWGGRDLVEALSRKLSLSLEQAENVLRNPSMIEDSHPQGLIPLLGEALEGLRREIRHMDLVCKGLCHEPVQRVYLSGGASAVRGLPDWLEDSVRLPVERLRALSSLSPSGVSYAEMADARMSIAAGLAMSQVGPDRSLCINFRKGEFARVGQGRDFDLSALKAPLVASAIAGTIFFISMAVQGRIYGGQLEEKDAQLKKAMSAFFGSVSQSALRTYLASPQSLKNSLQKELEKNRELARVYGPNPKSPLLYLKAMSDGIPKDVVVDVMRFQVGAAAEGGFDPKKESTVTLSLLANDPKAADRLSALLVPKLLQPPKGSEKPSVEEVPPANGKPRRYRMTWTGTANFPNGGQ
jgi:type IV pilus assembly protein PilM